MKSRLLGLGIIALLYSGSDGDIRLDRIDGVPPTRWYEGKTEADDPNPAFAHNLTSLVEEIERDGASILLVPYRLSKGYDVPEEHFVRANERTLREIAAKKNLALAPFPAGVITASNWVDGSHLNAAGCREKAEHIAEFVIRVLWKDGSE